MSISSLAKYRHLNHLKPPPFSLFRRRMEDFALARTIGISMNIWSKMPILSPSSQPSSTNSWEQSCAPRWTFDGGTTTFASRKGTNGRWCSSCYSDKQNCYNVWYFCSVHNIVLACVGISLSVSGGV